jgi:hypothetical protein
VIQEAKTNVTIGHHLLRISAALGRHPNEPRSVPNARRNISSVEVPRSRK